MKKYINPDRSEWSTLVQRVSVNDDVIAGRVEAILARVKSEGDKAIRELAREIDGVELDAIEVSADEFAEAASLVSQEVKDAIAAAAVNIAKFHAAQSFKPIEVDTCPGVKCVQRSVAIQKVGLYVPGGTAPLFSTVLMLAIPATVAGCKQIILCTPTNKQGKVAPAVLYAAKVCGVHHVYKVGGAQAVGAMAYGTETIPAVDKIFGPGNRYVTKAKESVTDRVSIDMPAGPSEVMVMADETADPRFVASDLLSQAEHGADSQALLVCGSEEIADAVCREVERQLEKLPRKELTMKALVESRLVVLPSVEEQIEFANMYASEHLIISMKEPWKVAEQITAAGSVFIGNYSPESAGDYASGTNHTLPTSGWARSCSGVNIDSFTRKITYQELTAEGMSKLGPTIVAMAVAEGLDAHANAARLRMGEEI
ncbi:MAG: histidinol dehydrogenase [Bacteroidaceae bacterium]|nr:histidinol dehydrogenase [Bacteroidaceae bacterium]MBQ4038528.1 histidinol dehydrogenase [Bacteroidaceae bacterium]